MNRLAIVGAGALAQDIAQHVTQAGTSHIAGFFDDFTAMDVSLPFGRVLGSIDSARALFERGIFDSVLLGVGYRDMALRERLFDELADDLPFGRFVHPAAYVDPSAKLGPGAFVSPGCVLDLKVELEANTFLSTACIVAHDVRLGSHSFLAPGVRLAGGVRTGPRCFLGIGTTIIDGCVLGAEVRTGAGTVVTHDLPEDGTYVGAPARRL